MDQIYVGTKDDIKQARYQVEDYSVSGHCCFEASVIDMDKKDPDRTLGAIVCECFEKEDAERIAFLLNFAIRWK